MSTFQEQIQFLDNLLNNRFDIKEEEEEEEEEEEKKESLILVEDEQPTATATDDLIYITEDIITAPRSEPIVEEQEAEEEIDVSIPLEYDEIEIDKTSIDYENKNTSVATISKNAVPESMTLDQFINNKTINRVAYDFFQEMGDEGSAADVAYYFRKEISVDDMIRRMNQSKKWSNEQKDRYMWLQEHFNNTNWSDSSFQQKFKAVRQYGWQAMSDPSMIAAMLLAPFTGGGSVAARTGATEAGKFMIRQAIANTMKSGLTKNNVHTLARSLVSTPAKSTATYTGAYSGVIERLDQEIDIELGVQKGGVNYTDWATHTGLGIILGGTLGKGIEKLPVVTTPVKNAIAKAYQKTDELTDKKLTAATETLIQRPIDFLISRSFGTAVAEYKTIVKYSPTAKRILESINALGLKRIYQQAKERIPNGYVDDAWGWQGEFSTKLATILEPLKSGVRHRIKTRSEGTSAWSQLKGGWRGIHRVDDETNILLAEALRGTRMTKSFMERVKEAAKGGIGKGRGRRAYTVKEFRTAVVQLRKLDDAAFDLAVKEGLPLRYVSNHFPRIYSKYLETKEGKELFINELITSGQVKNENQALLLIEEMLNKADRFGLGSNINSRFARTIDKVDDRNLSPILDNNVEEVYRKYFWDISRLSSEARHGGVPQLQKILVGKDGTINKVLSVTGENTKGIGAKIFEATKSGGLIEQELKAAGKEHLLGSNKQKLERLEKMWNFTIGNLPQLKGAARLASETWQVVNQVATLPLATLTSLSEVFVPLTRVDAPNYAKNLGKVLAVRGKTTVRNLYKGLDIKTPKWLTKSETMESANSVFVALDQATMQRLDSIFAGDIRNPILKGVQRGFFRLNLLAEWTKTVELAGYMMGKDLIKKNARKLAKGGYSKPSIERYTLELNELNVDIPTAIKWANGELSKKQMLLFERQINKGGGRFARQIILNPKKAGLTSLWLQDPRYNILTQLLAYPYAFGNTIMKRFAKGMLQGPVQSAQALVGGTMMAMTGIMGNEWRTQGERDWVKRSDAEVISEGIKRVGGLGMLEYVWRGAQAAEYTNWGGILTMLKVTPLLGSPTGSDLIDFFTGRKSMREILVTKSPVYQAYPKHIQKQMQAWAKEGTAESRNNMYNFLKGKGMDKPEKLAYPKRKPQFKGGAVSEDYPVPNVIKDPSERVDPYTGQPYDAEMERLGMKDGLMVSVGVAPVSEKQIDKLKKALEKRKAKRDGGSADIEEIEVLARKRGQYILDEDIVEGPFTSYYNKPVRLKKTVMKDLIKAQEEIPNIPINIVDNTVRKDVKVKARKDWIARGRKGPPQAGAKSYHITGQAFDLNQEDPKMNNPEVWEVLRKNNFKQHPKEWWHFSQGEFIN